MNEYPGLFNQPWQIRIGTSGWSYRHWGGILYPQEANSVTQLKYYLKKFDTVEINSSFYHWPRTTTILNWWYRTPATFLITLKAPRQLTHSKRLYSPEKWMHGISRDLHQLRQGPDKLGPLLVQLSPFFEKDLPRLRYFLQQIPAWLQPVLEFRHPSWHVEDTFNLLEEYRAAYCVMSGYQLSCVLRATSGLVYVRLHGANDNGNYHEGDLQWWAERIREWAGQGRKVLVYFNNDGGGFAVYNALRLKEILQC
jgi:uncharacterized protein YecE (DUF72 family)